LAGFELTTLVVIGTDCTGRRIEFLNVLCYKIKI